MCVCVAQATTSTLSLFEKIFGKGMSFPRDADGRFLTLEFDFRPNPNWTGYCEVLVKRSEH